MKFDPKNYGQVMNQVVQTIRLHKQHVCAQDILKQENLFALASTMSLQAYVEEQSRRLVIMLVAELPALLDERIIIHKRWPKDWWQAFKHRWFPSWMLRRWPVQYDEVCIDRPVYKAVCPHLDVSGTEGKSVHFEWLALKENEV